MRLKILLPVFAFILVIKSCTDKNNTKTELSKTEDWIKNHVNYKDSKKYQTVFFTTYNEYLKNKKYDRAKLLLFKYGNIVYLSSKHDSLYSNALEKFFDANYKVEKDTIYANLYWLLSIEFLNKNDMKSAIKMSEKALLINNKQSIDTHIRANNILGNCYNYTSQPEKAIKTFTELMPYVDEKKTANLGSFTYCIGYAYEMLYAHSESEKMYNKAAKLFLKAKDTSLYYAIQTYNAENVFFHKNDTLKTIKFIDSVTKEFKSFKNTKEADFIGINNIKALKSFLTKDYDSAFYYNNKNITFSKDEKLYLSYYQLFENKIYFEKYKKLQDKNKLTALIDEFLAAENYLLCQQIYFILYKNALIENNFKEAITFRDKEIELKEKILKTNQKGQLFEYEKKFEAEKKEKIITQKNIELAKNKLFLILAVVSIFAILFATLLFFVRRKKKEIVETNKLQERFTFQLLQNTEEERNRIANELHDSVNHDLLNLKNTLVNGNTIEVKTIENVIEEVRNISRNLYPSVLQNLGFEASVESLCERVTNEAGLFVTCDIKYIKKLSKSKEMQLYRIIQEALNNTLKHGKANAAKVIVNSTENNLTLEIKDNGNGFNVDEQLKSSASFGLQSMLQRAKAIAAKINIESSNKGTTIFINIPT